MKIGLPSQLKAETVKKPCAQVDTVQWLYGRKAFFKPVAEAKGLNISGLKKYMALERRWYFWTEPVFGGSEITSSGKSLPEEILFFLGTDAKQSEHVLILPLIAGDWRGYLKAEGGRLTLGINGGSAKSVPQISEPLFVVARGKDAASLIENTMELVRRKLGTFKLSNEKNTPEFVDWFGWCTWNAFYGSVSAQKVLDGLKTFKDGGISPKFMILDDGWLDTDKLGRLSRFSANKKFPGGLGKLVQQTRDQFGIELFGLWHAFQGYWAGVNPDGPLAKEYKVNRRQGLRPAKMQKQEVGLVDKADIYRFYQDFYAHLATQGIDMVKVDSQSGLQELAGPGFGLMMQAYQRAMQGAAGTFFNGNLLHCMSNSQEVAYNMAGSNVWRNSDDFYPDKPLSHTHHLIQNAYNAIWSSTFSIPDWDMFESGHTTARFHGAARAISGGPVYVSDKPGEQNFGLIRKLILGDGRVLRSPQAATVCPQRLYHNPEEGEGALLICNRNGNAGVLGAFNCRIDGKPVEDTVCAGMSGLAKGALVCFDQLTGKIRKVGVKSKIALKLGKLKFALLHFVPIEKGIAPLGLIDKYNCTAAVLEAKWLGSVYCCTMVDGGKIGFYVKGKPESVTVDGRSCAYKYDSQSGLLVLRVAGSGKKLVQITL